MFLYSSLSDPVFPSYKIHKLWSAKELRYKGYSDAIIPSIVVIFRIYGGNMPASAYVASWFALSLPNFMYFCFGLLEMRYYPDWPRFLTWVTKR